jgi:hypothetical protein
MGHMTLHLNGILAYIEEGSLKKVLLSGGGPGEKRNTRPPIFKPGRLHRDAHMN